MRFLINVVCVPNKYTFSKLYSHRYADASTNFHFIYYWLLLGLYFAIIIIKSNSTFSELLRPSGSEYGFFKTCNNFLLEELQFMHSIGIKYQEGKLKILKQYQD